MLPSIQDFTDSYSAQEVIKGLTLLRYGNASQQPRPQRFKFPDIAAVTGGFNGRQNLQIRLIGSSSVVAHGYGKGLHLAGAPGCPYVRLRKVNTEQRHGAHCHLNCLRGVTSGILDEKQQAE
jgi:hypothetical protein